jgi:hypothetical protein
MFFSKKEPPRDSTLAIYLDDEHMLPLTIDDARYAAGIQLINGIVRKWVDTAYKEAEECNIPIKDSLLGIFRNTDVKFTPYILQIDAIQNALHDNDVSRAGSRFFDMIVLIHTLTPTDVIECLKGRFLYGVLYGIPKTINDTATPSKEEWVSLLAVHPWIPFLQIIQTIIDDYMAETSKNKFRSPTVVTPRAAS